MVCAEVLRGLQDAPQAVPVKGDVGPAVAIDAAARRAGEESFRLAHHDGLSGDGDRRGAQAGRRVRRYGVED